MYENILYLGECHLLALSIQSLGGRKLLGLFVIDTSLSNTPTPPSTPHNSPSDLNSSLPPCGVSLPNLISTIISLGHASQQLPVSSSPGTPPLSLQHNSIISFFRTPPLQRNLKDISEGNRLRTRPRLNHFDQHDSSGVTSLSDDDFFPAAEI